MLPAVAEAEMQALTTRAAEKDMELQAALQQQDWQAVREHEIELSRLHARFCELERQVA